MQLVKGKRYQATVTLKGLQAIAPNSEVMRKFVELGFINVSSAGSGASRTVTGMWGGTTVKIDLPKEVSNVKEIV